MTEKTACASAACKQVGKQERNMRMHACVDGVGTCVATQQSTHTHSRSLATDALLGQMLTNENAHLAND